jgi:transcriptional regulator with XRE-family HTH domain
VPDQESTWRSRLKHERIQLGLTQAELAFASGLSAEAIRKYESGGRTPTRRHLLDILGALHVPRAQVRQIVASAGFAPETDLLPSDALDGYAFTLAEAAAEIERSPWPRFVTGGAMDVVAANRVAARLWGLDVSAELLRRNRAGAHVIPAMAEPWFAGRVANFDELLRMVIGVLKGIPDGAAALDDPTPWAEKVLGALATTNPGVVGPLLDAWEATPPQKVRPRWEYRVVWQEPEGEIRFAGLVSLANERDGLSFNDWIPADAESHVTLERVLAARGGSATQAMSGRPRGVGHG